MNRNLTDVIDQMLKEIPLSEETLIARLRSQRESAAYASETMQKFWALQVAKTLVNSLSDGHADVQPSGGWQLTIYNIWMEKENPSCPSSVPSSM